jgi:hypothetical protein
MAIFCTIVNLSASLGEEFIGSLQTVDLDGCLAFYWLAKDDTLYRIVLPTMLGEHGRVITWRVTGPIEVINRKFERKIICFSKGRLISPCC